MNSFQDGRFNVAAQVTNTSQAVPTSGKSKDTDAKIEAVQQHIEQDGHRKQGRPEQDHVRLPCAISATGLPPATANGRFGLSGRG